MPAETIIDMVRTALLAGLCLLLWRVGAEWSGRTRSGWRCLMSGALLLLAGSLAGAINGDMFLPALLAYLAGSLLLGYGIWRWLPALSKHEAAVETARVVAGRERDLFFDAIESIQDGFALFDASDRLLTGNSRFHEIMDCQGEGSPEGALFGEVVSRLAAMTETDQARREVWLQERMIWHRNHAPGDGFELQCSHRRSWMVREYPTRDGGCVLLFTDLTPLRRTESALYASEMALWESEQRFSGILENAADAIMVHDLEGQLVQVNRAACEALGFERAELMRLPVDELMVDHDPLLLRRVWENLESGKSVTIQARYRRRDGSIFSGETRISPYRSGERRLVVASARDMTRRERQEAALRQAEQTLTDAIESLNDGFVIWDARDRLVLCNSAYRNLFPGIGERVVPGLAFGDMMRMLVGKGLVVHGGLGRDWIADRIKRHLACEGAFELNTVDGRTLVAGERRTGDGGTVCVVTDVTELLVARQALQTSEERFRALVETSSDWIWEIDAEGRFTYASPQSMEILGWDAAEIIGHRRSELICPDDDEGRRAMEEMIASRAPIDGLEAVCRHRNGVAVVLETRAVPIIDGEGRLVGYRGTDRDVTERREARMGLMKAMRQAESANRAKSEFLAGMSHELRTPLNAVIGFSEVALTGVHGPLSDAYRDYLGHIRDAGLHLLDIIGDILDVTRMEADDPGLNEEETDAGAIIESALRLVRQRAARGRHRLQEKVGGELPRVYGDPRRLRQILVNLLSNAVKFTPDGGDVVLDAHMDEAGALVVRVSDSGIGMEAQDIPKAMAPFSQLDSGITRHFEGTGMGLYLTDKLVRLHGGTLKLESVKGKGTTATVRLPPDRMRA